jgi:hypothetical protein
MVFKKKETPVVKSYVSNPSLVTMKQDWPGTPLAQNAFFTLTKIATNEILYHTNKILESLYIKENSILNKNCSFCSEKPSKVVKVCGNKLFANCTQMQKGHFSVTFITT